MPGSSPWSGPLPACRPGAPSGEPYGSGGPGRWPVPGLARRGARRYLARAGPGEPDRRAHRLQLRLGAAVRAGQRGRGGRRAARRRRAGHPLAPVAGPGCRATIRARPGWRDRLGRLPGRRRLGHAGGRPPRGRRQPGHRFRLAAGRWPVVLGRDRVRGGDRPRRPVRGGRATHRTRPAGQAGGERDGRRAQRDHGPVRVAARRGRACPAARLPLRADHAGAVRPGGGRARAARGGHRCPACADRWQVCGAPGRMRAGGAGARRAQPARRDRPRADSGDRGPGAGPPGPPRGLGQLPGVVGGGRGGRGGPGWAGCCTTRTPRCATTSRSPGRRPTWRPRRPSGPVPWAHGWSAAVSAVL
jgi:hypothetical protein